MADGATTARAASPRDVQSAVRRIASALRFEVRVPGTHYSGLTYEHLLQILDDQGRPFLDNTRSLRAHVGLVLGLAFEGARQVPTVRELERVASAALLDWIVRRRFGGDSDVRMRALTPRYREAKGKAGFTGPLGVRTGALRDAVKRARVEIL